MTRRLGILAALAVAALAAALSACGGDDEDVRTLLDEAFSQPIESAVVNADVEVRLEGVEQLSEPIRVKLSGPYRSAEGKLPAFDWDVSFAGGGQTISADLVSTTENLFVGFQGTAYEVGARTVARFNRQLAEAEQGEEDRGLARFGIDPRDWLSDPEDEGDEEIAGIETTHVSAGVDVGRLLADLNKLIDRAGGAVPGAAPPPRLTEEQREQVEDVVEEPTLDVHVAKDDKTVRRLSVNLGLDVPEDARERVGGLERGSISFSIELSRLGEEQRIDAPERARPIEELAEQIAGAGGLGAAAPDGATGSGGAPSGEARGGSREASPTPGSFQRYAECLREADPNDVQAIRACSELLG